MNQAACQLLDLRSLTAAVDHRHTIKTHSYVRQRNPFGCHVLDHLLTDEMRSKLADT